MWPGGKQKAATVWPGLRARPLELTLLTLFFFLSRTVCNSCSIKVRTTWGQSEAPCPERPCSLAGCLGMRWGVDRGSAISSLMTPLLVIFFHLLLPGRTHSYTAQDCSGKTLWMVLFFFFFFLNSVLVGQCQETLL